ncbi:hypothetical protein ACFVFS_19960 [Kitasatospora sp. NPDC057692]|uniref:hypothetical protein n=1 Tax=Kitasatospora sp. NPDC057692 TaxID=3346215 RepID=UPI0036C9E255
MACLIGVPGSSQAAVTAYPTADLDVRYGSTYATGTVAFYGRSVEARVAYRSVDPLDCRFVVVQALDSLGHQIDAGSYGTTPGVCGASTSWHIRDVPADVPGGAASVRVVLNSSSKTDGAERVLASQRVFP